MASLLAAVDGAVTDRPDALVLEGSSTSFAELRRRADIVAARIAGASAVGVHATPTHDTVIGVVAAILAGVPVVPLPPDAGPIERAHLVRDSALVATLGATPWDDLDVPAVSLDGDGVGSGTTPRVDEDRPAMIMYTSGTTGAPKGAVISRRAIAADLDALADAWAWTADDHLVHGLPLFHVHGLVLGVLGSLRIGSRLTHTGRPNPAAYAQAAGSLYFGVPTVWSRVAADTGSARALRSARLLVSGSAPLPVALFRRLAELTGQAPVERYGMTETLITVSTRAGGERRPGHVGLPLAGVETRIVDDGGDPAPRDGQTVGGLQVRGATMFDGYLRGGRPEDFTPDGWFVTGDAATIGPDGFHRIVGRTSVDIIKSGGFKVGAGEVEAVVADHPGVAEVAVVGVPDDDLGQRIVAVVVPAAGVDATGLAADIDRFVAERLTSHKRPREVRVVEELPRNAMGKVVKARLAAG